MGVIRAEAARKYPDCKAMYVVDIDTARVAEVAKMYGCTPLHTNDIETALKDPKVHAVFISTTSHTHFDIIVAAAKAGKNIFCEKPLALSAKETQVCVEEAKKAGVVLYCGFQRRSDPEFLKMREKMIASKGKIELVRISSRDGANHNPISYLLSSGGYFYDSLIHDFDEARWIVGEEPISVYCTGTAFFKEIREAGDIDAVVVVLRFPSGVIASIDNHRRAMYGYDQRLEVHTSAGQFQVQNQARSVVVESNAKGIITDNPPAGLDRYKEAYEAEVFHFFDLLSKKGVKPRVLPEDCLYGAYIAEAAKESLKTGKVVSLL
jgi:myo-inositol 2-dehydrogenase/D-chiro-inositol 1-dehydrogenase